MPAAISTFIDASNKLDLESFVNLFSEDAVVLDEGKKRIGQKAIKKWSDQFLEQT
ncbi:MULTISPECIES: SgcJ/EcaC family oxidoreductase [unclassified Paenibacillus]|uniref:SgcJ/EcaC family oxidoreductase n=1 Tax=unclassified Paenibacillus TaxID=185978 RepID=UPI0040485657